MQGFNRTPWNATSRTTAQDALWQHILNRNTNSQPLMTPCARHVMNRISGNVTPPWAGCWGPPRSYSMSVAIYLPAQRPTNSKADPPDRNPPPSQHPEERTPEGEERTPYTCSPYKQSGGSSGFSPPGPAFSLQREYLCSYRGDRWEVAGPDFRG